MTIYYSIASWFLKLISYVSKIASNTKQVQQKFQEAGQNLRFPICMLTLNSLSKSVLIL